MFYPLIAETETDVVNKDLEDQYKHSYKHKMFYPLIAEIGVVNKDLEDQYKYIYRHKMFYPLIAVTETGVVNKDLEDQYKHRATNMICFILSLQRQRLMW